MGAAVLALAGFQIISGIHQAETIRANAALSKEINEMNAEFAELDAYNAELNGLTQEARYQNVIDATLSTQKVALASQDIDINFGSAKEFAAETKLNGFLNQVDIRNQAHATALGYKAQARSLRLSGKTAEGQANLQASATQNAALIGGLTTALPTLTGYASKLKNINVSQKSVVLPATARTGPK